VGTYYRCEEERKRLHAVGVDPAETVPVIQMPESTIPPPPKLQTPHHNPHLGLEILLLLQTQTFGSLLRRLPGQPRPGVVKVPAEPDDLDEVRGEADDINGWDREEGEVAG
jgi:hypothetical protein